MADKAPKGIWNTYEKEGDKAVKKSKYCPKCGAGFTLASHGNRLYCGACKYVEFLKVEKQEKK